MRIVYVVVVFALLLTAAAGIALSRSAPQGPDVGAAWLNWSAETKIILVDEYTAGYIDGSTQTCGVASKLLVPARRYSNPEDMPEARCMHTVRNFSRHADYYAVILDQFYKTYPDDRDVPARFVLRRLYDGNSISVRELHELARAGALQISQGD